MSAPLSVQLYSLGDAPANDLDGTIVHETIYHAAGSQVPMGMTRAELVRLIREAGRIPVERDTEYGVIEELPKARVPEAARAFVTEGVRRLAAYQDLTYARLYLDRLGPIRSLDSVGH